MNKKKPVNLMVHGLKEICFLCDYDGTATPMLVNFVSSAVEIW